MTRTLPLIDQLPPLMTLRLAFAPHRRYDQSVSSRSKRLTFSAVIAAGGAALCLALDHYWWSKLPLPRGLPKYPPLRIAGASGPFESASGDLLFVTIPFYVLAALITVTRIRALAALVGAVAIAALTVFEYRWANTTDSSTAGLAFTGAIELGVPIAIAAWGLDRLASRVHRNSGRSVEGHSP